MSRRTENREPGTGGISRRDAIAATGLGALGMALPSWQEFLRLRTGSDEAFFTPAERALVTALADMIIPRDERSGNVSDSGGIDYIDFVAGRQDDKGKAALREELAWYDEECTRRFGRGFVACTEAERGQLLDAIAWPARATAELKPRAEFFNRLRDVSATAFFSSRMGVQDLGYLGNVYNPDWRGAPTECMEQLGLSYDEWDRRYGGLQ